jgi:non-specific serine/threonine protein kinase
MNAPPSVEDAVESAAEMLALSPGRRLGEFLITRVVGQGGFGIVYEAEDLALQRRIAIKEYMPSQLATRIDGVRVQPISSRYAKTFELGRKSFIAEARLLAQFRHPGLLEVLHFWSQNGTAYMAMPFYEGRTLEKVLAKSRGVISEKWLGAMIRPVLDALEHMHDEDCYHRDVSPDNILIREDGRALLLDLGAARHVIGDRERALTMMLKPGYAPIEQYADDPACRQGPWTDIYAVAAVLYFAVTAKMPPASASRVMHDSLSPLAKLRPAGYGQPFLEAIDRGLAIRPEDRPRNVAEFRSLLFTPTPGDAPASRADGATAHEAGSGARRARHAERVADASRKEVVKARQRAEVGTAPADAAGEEPTKAAARGRGGSSKLRKRSVPLAATAAIVCAVAVAWMAWPTGRTAASGEAEVAASVQRSDAAVAQRDDAASAQRDDAAPVPRDDAAPLPRDDGAPVSPNDAGPAQAVAAAAAGAAEAVASRSANEVAPPVAAAPSRAAAGKTPPRVVVASAQRPPAQTGTLRLSVAPWGEVFVDGASRGVTPPLKQIVLSAGKHRVEIRNPAGPSWSKEIVVRSGKQETISHRFR